MKPAGERKASPLVPPTLTGRFGGRAEQGRTAEQSRAAEQSRGARDWLHETCGVKQERVAA